MDQKLVFAKEPTIKELVGLNLIIAEIIKMFPDFALDDQLLFKTDLNKLILLNRIVTVLKNNGHDLDQNTIHGIEVLL